MARAAKSHRTPAEPKPTIGRIPVLPVRDTVHFPGVIQTLLVGRELSVRALQNSQGKDGGAIVLSQRDQHIDNPTAADLYRIGTLSEILHVLPLPDGTMRVVFRGLARVEVDHLQFRSGAFSAEYHVVEQFAELDSDIDALMREVSTTFQKACSLGIQIPPEVSGTVTAIDNPGLLADTIAQHLPITGARKQELLELFDPHARLTHLLKILTSELQILELQTDLRNQVERELGQSQKEFYLREQLRVIQQELGGDATISEEGVRYQEKLRALGMSPQGLERVLNEVVRLERAPTSSPESLVIRTYLDWLIALPWNILTTDSIDIQQAAKSLDQEHFGLEKVKDRILDFLAVRQLSPTLRGPILCFVGPPGVGKTSLGRSIAEAMGRKFQRISLGGIRDEAEIRGHRRTYVGSMPGRIIQALRTCGSRNPVIMLDEIDKLAADMRGDPTSALLEALDPEQNRHFSDHYIEVPFDLSAVLFICTANLIENIPAPLRDRMEIVQFPSYTEMEKLQIAEQFLVPHQVVEHGLSLNQFTIEPAALKRLIREYTREAGVRNLNREIATLCRKGARRLVEMKCRTVAISPKGLESLLGHPRFRYGENENLPQVGAATGLVYSEYGGDIITLEVSLAEPFTDRPSVYLTGSLGEIMKESAHAAMSYLRQNQAEYSDRPFRFDLHLHVPEGAVPKDGPSAGLAILAALVSAFSNRAVRNDVAMTGELTLRGKILPVGGIREKILAAHRAGIGTVVLPIDNRRDLDEVPASVRGTMEFIFVENAREALEIVLC